MNDYVVVLIDSCFTSLGQTVRVLFTLRCSAMSSLCLVIYLEYVSPLTGETDDKVRWLTNFDNWNSPSVHVTKESPVHR